MWWARVSVRAWRGALVWADSDCLSACVGASALLCLSPLFMLRGSGDNRALLDPVTVFPLRPKVWTLTGPMYIYCISFFFFLVWFNPGFQSHFDPFFFVLLPFAMKNLWHAERGCVLKAGCSLTLLSGPISVPGGLLNCLRCSVRKRGRGKDRKRGKAGWSSNNAGANQISQEWISCV